MPTQVIALTCPNCGYTIFSRAHHDFRSCSCGGVYIDGGLRNYTRVGWYEEKVGPNPPEAFGLLVNATERELYDDWNQRLNQWGMFPPGVLLDKVPLQG